MANETQAVNALVTAARYDISRGMRRDDVLRSLSRVISRDLLMKVIDRL